MQKTVVTYTDDLTQKPAEDIETVEFAVNGKTFEIDLNKLNARNFYRSVAKYMEHGRKVTSKASKHVDGRKVTHSKEYVQTVRQWAQDNGIEVASRGRVPLSVYDLYEKAN